MSVVLNHVEALILVLDLTGRIRRINRAFELVTGRSKEHVLGTPFSALMVLPEKRHEMEVLFERFSGAAFPNTHRSYWTGPEPCGRDGR